MTLSTSRQQFLAYESQTPEDIQYGRKGGIFISTCVCIGFVISAVILAVLVGIIVYYITYFKLSQKPADFWDDTEPFGQVSSQSPDFRLPTDVTPSFYRLKLTTDLDNSTFFGTVSITIKANKRVKEIILHSKDLVINDNAKLTEQIYERLETILHRSKRDIEGNVTTETVSENNDTIPINETQNDAPKIYEVTTPSPVANETANETHSNATISELPTANSSLETVPVTENNTIPTTTTTMHTVEVPTQVTHSNTRSIKITSIKKSTGDRLIVTLASPLKTDVDYILELSFEGNISDSFNGFYKSNYVNNNKEVKQLAVTQFEATSARQAFPCFDEPSFKAKFELSIAHSDKFTALGNMRVATQEDIPEKLGWQWTHFERSVKMSTYLVAYVLCDFQSLETSYLSKDNKTKPIKIWARPELIESAKYAAKITPILLEYYEELFGLPYALDKLDLIAIPDFASGAMENWGLITFRETGLLYDEKAAVPRLKTQVATNIAHELAHQWFGNLVTMQWWTDLWLNEGFATYIEYVGVDKIEPQWKILETFTQDQMELFRSDALKNTPPVSRRVIDASEISQKFDAISYIKGATLIRMLNHTISEEVFRKGLVDYLNKWKYSNAEENDLWASMSAATSPRTELVSTMNSWTRQPGLPAVTCIRDYDKGTVSFQQRLFTTSTAPYKAMADQLWEIPITYTNVSSTEIKTLWLKTRAEETAIDVGRDEALYVNVGAVGYYRVNYDQQNWELLSTALKSGQMKSPITKAQLIDDAFNLAKATQLNYSYALDLATSVIDGEESKMVWSLLLNNMEFIKYSLRASSANHYFQDFIKLLIRKQLSILNYGQNKPKDDTEALLIEKLLSWECYVQVPRCLRWAHTEFENWASKADLNDNPIFGHLRELVYVTALRTGGRREFDFLWNVFLNTTDPAVQSLVISSLSAVQDEALVRLLLERSLDEIPKQYAVAVWRVEPPVGTAVARRFLVDNFDRIYEKFTAMDAFKFPEVLVGVFGFITTQEDLDDLKSFAMKHKAKLASMSQTLQKMVDTATIRVRWLATHARDITDWIRDYLAGNTTDNTNTISTTPSNANNSTSNINNNSTTAIDNVNNNVTSSPTSSESKSNNESQNITTANNTTINS